MNGLSEKQWVLSSLPLPVRLVIGLFLISVGIGYFAALVQLHFQAAAAGQLLPGAEEVVATYHGRAGIGQLERVLVTEESKPFNGSGSMRPAFTTRSAGFARAINAKAKELKLDSGNTDQLKRAKLTLLSEREGERLAVLAWIHAGTDQQKSYEADSFPLPAKLAKHPITAKYVDPDTKAVKIHTMFQDRCERCHSVEVGGPAASFPLDSFERLREYCQVETVGGGMSLTKLAQTTHVHLLGFAMLYGLTGLIFSFTSYPLWFRCLVAPLPLAAQLADISCWWLGRMDPLFAQAIRVTGGIVAAGLGLHILLGLFNLFTRRGRLVLLVLLFVALATGLLINTRIIQPYLESERMGTVSEVPPASPD